MTIDDVTQHLDTPHRVTLDGKVTVFFKRRRGTAGHRCTACREIVRQGEQYVKDAQGRWFHVDCAGVDTTIASHEQSGCPECFMINCDCERDRA